MTPSPSADAELKSCPFCGGMPELHEDQGYALVCTKCAAQGPSDDHFEVAWDRWNTRAIDTEVVSRTKELEERLAAKDAEIARLTKYQKAVQSVTCREAEAVRQCKEIMLSNQYQSSGEDISDLVDIVSDFFAADRQIPNGEYEGSDCLADTVRWCYLDRNEAREQRDQATASQARVKELEAAMKELLDAKVYFDFTYSCWIFNDVTPKTERITKAEMDKASLRQADSIVAARNLLKKGTE